MMWCMYQTCLVKNERSIRVVFEWFQCMGTDDSCVIGTYITASLESSRMRGRRSFEQFQVGS